MRRQRPVSFSARFCAWIDAAPEAGLVLGALLRVIERAGAEHGHRAEPVDQRHQVPGADGRSSGEENPRANDRGDGTGSMGV
jgi:hypothetical protein